MKQFFIKTVILLVLAPLSALALVGAPQSTLIPYYGEEFYQQLRSGGNSQDLTYKIKQVMRSYHIPQGNGQPDMITGDCQGQGRCYKHQSIGYGRARVFLLGNYYLVKDGAGYGVREVYCDRTYTDKDFRRGQAPAPNQVPDNTVVNVEHTWPQSRFSGRHPTDYQKSDLHHLYPTDSELNSIRGNNRFGEVERDAKTLKCNSGARFGRNGKSPGEVFEPPQHHKGNVARSLFYFSLRYDLPIDPVEEGYLRKWAKEDPVDQEEINRNEAIYKVQGNRNPFVDFPELYEKVSDF